MQACNHPYLVPDCEPGETGINPQAEQKALVAASSKMALLHRLLPKLKAAGRRVLLLSQMTKVAAHCLDSACILTAVGRPAASLVSLLGVGPVFA